MLHPNVLPLSLLQWSYLLNALHPTLGAKSINSTLNAAPSDSVEALFPIYKPSPVCVNNTQHPTWGLTLEEFDFSICQHALDLISTKIEGDRYTSYEFFSRQAFPNGHVGWPLAQGSGAG